MSLKLESRRDNAPLKLGPGPSPASESTLRAGLWNPEHMEPEFLAVSDQLNSRLRTLFGTENRITFAGFGTGSTGIENMIANCLEAGDSLLVLANGVFGQRAKEMAECHGICVEFVEHAFGEPISLEALETSLKKLSKLNAVFFVLAETSNGLQSPGEEIVNITHRYFPEALILVDAVTAIGGIEILADQNRYDVVSAGSQKCLSTPTGLFPITYSEKAIAVIENRKSPVPSWSYNPLRLAKYLGQTREAKPRRYITTAETTLICQLAEATHLICDEGLVKVFDRHARCGAGFRAGAQALGLEARTPDHSALPMLTPLLLPDGIQPPKLLADCKKLGISFGGGLGRWSENTIRVGLMGHGAQTHNVLLALDVLGKVLGRDSSTAKSLAREKFGSTLTR